MKRFDLIVSVVMAVSVLFSCGTKQEEQKPVEIAPFDTVKAEALSDKCDNIDTVLSQQDYTAMIQLMESGMNELNPMMSEVIESGEQEKAVTLFAENSELTDKMDYVAGFRDYVANAELDAANKEYFERISSQLAEFDTLSDKIMELVYNKYELY